MLVAMTPQPSNISPTDYIGINYMDRCVQTFEEYVASGFDMNVKTMSSGEAMIYVISLEPKAGIGALLCAHPDHGHNHGEASISAEMVVDSDDGKKVASVSTVVVGCWTHGPGSLKSADLKGCGVGTMLMLICECIALAAGADEITLDDDSGISGFYEALGYDRPDGDEVMVKTPDESEWKMRVGNLISKIESLVEAGKCGDIWKDDEAVGLGKRGRRNGSDDGGHPLKR